MGWPRALQEEGCAWPPVVRPLPARPPEKTPGGTSERRPGGRESGGASAAEVLAAGQGLRVGPRLPLRLRGQPPTETCQGPAPSELGPG